MFEGFQAGPQLLPIMPWEASLSDSCMFYRCSSFQSTTDPPSMNIRLFLLFFFLCNSAAELKESNWISASEELMHFSTRLVEKLQRDWHLSTAIRGPLKPIEHHDTIVLRGFRSSFHTDVTLRSARGRPRGLCIWRPTLNPSNITVLLWHHKSNPSICFMMSRGTSISDRCMIDRCLFCLVAPISNQTVSQPFDFQSILYLYLFIILHQELNLVVRLTCAISSMSSVSATLDTLPRG